MENQLNNYEPTHVCMSRGMWMLCLLLQLQMYVHTCLLFVFSSLMSVALTQSEANTNK